MKLFISNEVKNKITFLGTKKYLNIMLHFIFFLSQNKTSFSLDPTIQTLICFQVSADTTCCEEHVGQVNTLSDTKVQSVSVDTHSFCNFIFILKIW